MNDLAVHFSSKRMTWATPDALYAKVDALHHFTLDAAADAENARCATYYDEKANGLVQPWGGHRVWCNPPYGRALPLWVKKAVAERYWAERIVMLVPSRTDTRWWHEAIDAGARAEFIRGRLRFKGAAASAPFPSALLHWNC